MNKTFLSKTKMSIEMQWRSLFSSKMWLKIKIFRTMIVKVAKRKESRGVLMSLNTKEK